MRVIYRMQQKNECRSELAQNPAPSYPFRHKQAKDAGSLLILCLLSLVHLFVGSCNQQIQSLCILRIGRAAYAKALKGNSIAVAHIKLSYFLTN